jgi:hypothetical protein
MPLAVLCALSAVFLGIANPALHPQRALASGYSYHWENSYGPGQGDAEQMIYDDGRAVLYRATFSQGLWKYQGGFWSPVEGGPEVQSLYSIAFDSARNIIYAGTQSEGVWLCANPDTVPVWSDTGGGLSSMSVSTLYYESAGNDLFGGVQGNGVWRCDNPDTSPAWSNTFGGIGTSYVNGFAYDPTNHFLYAASGTLGSQGVWRCANPGTAPAWTRISTAVSVNTYTASALFYDAARNLLYAGLVDPATWQGKGVWRCAAPNTAPAWTDTGGVSDRDISSFAYNSTSNVLYAGDSQEGAWACAHPDGAPAWSNLDLPYQVYSIMYREAGVLYAGSFGYGVWSYSLREQPAVWRSMGGGLSNEATKSQVLDRTRNILYTGSDYAAVSRCDNPGLAPAWIGLAAPVGDGYVGDLALDETRDVLYASLDEGGLLRGAGASTSPAWTSMGPAGIWINHLAYDSVHNILYAVTENGVERCPNPDTSSAWTKLPGSQPANVYDLAYDPAHDVLFAGTNAVGVWRCANPGAASAWADTGGGITYRVNNLLYDAAADRLYAATDDHGVLRCTTPRTAPAWTNTGGGLSSVYDLAYDPGRDLLYAAALTGGPWICATPGGTPAWSPMGGEMAGDRVYSIACDPASGTVFAGTEWRGVWYTSETRFFFAEGYTGSGFQEYLCIANPNQETVELAVDYLFSDGTSLARSYTIDAGRRFTVDVNSEVGPDREVSVVARSLARGLVVERPLYFNYGDGWTGGSDVVGAGSASPTWYFAEGYTGPGFDEWVCVLNPGNRDASLNFRFQTQEEGEKVVGGQSVAAHSRATFKVNDLLGANYQCSLKLESDQPVVAERPMYFDYLGTTGDLHWNGGHCVMGAGQPAKEFNFAEGTTRSGFEEWITIQNPNGYDIQVTVEYQLGAGEIPPVARVLTVGAGKRETLFIPGEAGLEKDVSARLTSPFFFLAERPMYFDYTGYGADYTGGSCVIGAAASSIQWRFAEGYTGPDFQTWLTLQNPAGTAAKVQIIYLTQEQGALPAREITVPAGTRVTVRVNDDAGENLQVSTSILVTQGPGIIVERPMYFNYNGQWTGGHDVVGYSP